jgi:hypothetical protein
MSTLVQPEPLMSRRSAEGLPAVIASLSSVSDGAGIACAELNVLEEDNGPERDSRRSGRFL